MMFWSYEISEPAKNFIDFALRCNDFKCTTLKQWSILWRKERNIFILLQQLLFVTKNNCCIKYERDQNIKAQKNTYSPFYRLC